MLFVGLNHYVHTAPGFAGGVFIAAHGIDFGAGVVGDDVAGSHVAASGDFGVAGEYDNTSGGRVFNLIGLAVYLAVLFKLLAEFNRVAAGIHVLLAAFIFGNSDRTGLDIHGALFHNHIAAKGGILVFLIKRALVGFNLNRLVAVAF